MDIAQLESHMKKTVEHLESELKGLQVGRANSGLLDNIDIFIPSYGMNSKLSSLANISVIDAQTLRIECRDKSNVSSVEKGIYDSKTGLTPQNMGDYILVKIPQLNEERRRDLSKLVSSYGEDSKVALRNIRQDAQKEVKKIYDAKECSEDQKKARESDIDESTKKYTTVIDGYVKAKSEDIMKI